MNARLTSVAGDCSPAFVDLIPGQPITIGRSRENGLTIRDDLVSRLHAKVFFEAGKWFIRDFGLNGTKVNGNRVTGATELRENMELQIGHVVLRYAIRKPLDPSVSAPSPIPPAMKIETFPASPNALENRATRVTQNPPRRVAAEPSEKERTPKLETSLTGTTFLVPELEQKTHQALTEYMLTAVSLTDADELITLTLETINRLTHATQSACVDLDPTEPSPKIVVPPLSSLDLDSSRSLTESVRKGSPVWRLGSLGLGEADPKSLILVNCKDAIAVPLINSMSLKREPFAAIHAYKKDQEFGDLAYPIISTAATFLGHLLERIRHSRKLEAEIQRLHHSVSYSEEIIGDSTQMMAVRQQIGRASISSLTVLITGESGVGKELVALALHKNSARNQGPLVVVNCAAMTPLTLEAELFGYRRGAIANAEQDYAGLLQQAHDGTLFLDEIADLSLECQGKLLRVIENQPFRQPGSDKDIKVDVRVIAATNRDLDSEVKAGRFRHDLLFRLKVISIRVPPLREHPTDIIELARFFLERISQQLRRSIRLTPAAEQLIYAFPWPGNVRQLRAVLESAAAMAETDVIDADDLPLTPISTMLPSPTEIAAVTDAPTSLAIDDLETWAIVKALKQTAGNVSQAARVLKISRDTLHTKLKKKNIDRDAAVSSSPTIVKPEGE